MLKDKIIEIVNNLILLTDNKTLKWIEADPNTSTNHYKRKMVSQGEDGTKYEVEVKFMIVNDNWVLEQDAVLWIKNTLLPDGMMLVNSFKSDRQTIVLRDSIHNNFCQDLNPTIKDVEDILTNISKGISISQFREGRLNKILK